MIEGRQDWVKKKNKHIEERQGEQRIKTGTPQLANEKTIIKEDPAKFTRTNNQSLLMKHLSI